MAFSQRHDASPNCQQWGIQAVRLSNSYYYHNHIIKYCDIVLGLYRPPLLSSVTVSSLSSVAADGLHKDIKVAQPPQVSPHSLPSCHSCPWLQTALRWFNTGRWCTRIYNMSYTRLDVSWVRVAFLMQPKAHFLCKLRLPVIITMLLTRAIGCWTLGNNLHLCKKVWGSLSDGETCVWCELFIQTKTVFSWLCLKACKEFTRTKARLYIVPVNIILPAWGFLLEQCLCCLQAYHGP